MDGCLQQPCPQRMHEIEGVVIRQGKILASAYQASKKENYMFINTHKEGSEIPDLLLRAVRYKQINAAFNKIRFLWQADQITRSIHMTFHNQWHAT